MSGKRSRWDEAEEEEEDEELAQKKKDKKKKKQKQKKNAEEGEKVELDSSAAGESTAVATPLSTTTIENGEAVEVPISGQIPARRRRLPRQGPPPRLFPLECPPIVSCRHVDIYEKLNHIEEGSYGIVYRARDTETNEIVALKRLKLEREKNGFPITSLREISTLMAARHPNIVNIREVVMGDSLSQ